jgi:hypothetical protein
MRVPWETKGWIHKGMCLFDLGEVDGWGATWETNVGFAQQIHDKGKLGFLCWGKYGEVL